jgi:hypothetical protein
VVNLTGTRARPMPVRYDPVLLYVDHRQKGKIQTLGPKNLVGSRGTGGVRGVFSRLIMV